MASHLAQSATPRLFGARVKRFEDARFITGRGKYVDDFQMSGSLHVAFVRSPYAHARIRRMDLDPYLKNSSEIFTLTGAEIAGKTESLPLLYRLSLEVGLRAPHFPALAVEKARYVGEPVVAIAAPDMGTALDSLDLVSIDYEPLDAVANPEKALQPDAPILHEQFGDNRAYVKKHRFGNVEKAFREADIVVKERLGVQRISGAPMEPRAVIASYDPASDSMSVWMSTQSAGLLRSWLAEAIKWPEHKIRLIVPDVGGAFGNKLQVLHEEVATALLSIKAGRPVKWIETRRENFLNNTHAREQVHYVELAAKKDGLVIGLKDRIIADLGAYLQAWTPGPPMVTLALLPGNYRIANYDADLYGVFTNKTPLGALRGFGVPQANYVMERMMDILASELKIDPAEIRFRNMIQPNEFPYHSSGECKYDSGNYPLCLRKALDTIGYDKQLIEQKKARLQGKYLGLGMSVYVETTAYGPSSVMHEMGIRYGGFETAIVRFDGTGKITLITGSVPQGQGLETAYRQLVGDELGVNMEDVRVIHGDTDMVPFSVGTMGSRSAVLGGGAIITAARQVREKLLRIAGFQLEANPADLEVREGKVYVKGSPHRYVDFKAIGQAAYHLGYETGIPSDMEIGLEATAFYEPTSMPYASGAHVALVEVDVATGQVRVLRYVVVHDCGGMINPLLVEGQAMGGVVMGLGATLSEELIYDESGQPMTTTFMEYLLPTAVDVPEMQVEHVETPSPFTLYGMKGAGEGGMVPPPGAITNAVENALAPFKVRVRETPLTPQKVWALIKTSRRKV